MSIRHMSNTPCAKCGVDTRHYALVCTVCGTKHESNYEARRRSHIRHVIKRQRGYVPRSTYDSYRAANKARKADHATYVTAPAGNTSTFGKGRERVKA